MIAGYSTLGVRTQVVLPARARGTPAPRRVASMNRVKQRRSSQHTSLKVQAGAGEVSTRVYARMGGKKRVSELSPTKSASPAVRFRVLVLYL